MRVEYRVHLDLVSVKLRETEVKCGYREVKRNNTESKLKVAIELLHTTTLIWKIDGYNEALRQAKEINFFFLEGAAHFCA